MPEARSAERSQAQFPWAERLVPARLASRWWIGHIPFAFELVGRLQPSVIVELGTYSGSSFGALCQAAEACGDGARCYGIDTWMGDVHMGRFDEALFQDVSSYMASKHPGTATLIREDFATAASRFDAASIDLLHIDGTHTYEAVRADFQTWLPKVSERGVILFHDINVTLENTGPAAADYGVRRLWDEVREGFDHCEFSHCWGLGVLVVGPSAPGAVRQLVATVREPRGAEYFERKGREVQDRFEAGDRGSPPTGRPGLRAAIGALARRLSRGVRH